MLPVLLAMFAGMAAGYFLRSQMRLFSFLDPATIWTVRLLLFLLGYGIGRDRALLSQIPVLGFRGLVLALAALAGSVIAARLMIGDPSGDPQVSTEPTASTGRWNAVLGSLLAAGAFLLGLPAGALFHSIPELAVDPATLVLYLLMFMVGIGAGADSTAITMIKKHGLKLILLPFAVVVGTLAGTLAVGLLWPALPVRESMAVGAGFGYYSLSSLILKELSGGEWAAVALLSNIFREILTLLFAPLLFRAAGPSAPAAAGGATSMDTTLAAAVQCSGRAWAVPALFSGMVLTLLTPFAVTFIMTV